MDLGNSEWGRGGGESRDQIGDSSLSGFKAEVHHVPSSYIISQPWKDDVPWRLT